MNDSLHSAVDGLLPGPPHLKEHLPSDSLHPILLFHRFPSSSLPVAPSFEDVSTCGAGSGQQRAWEVFSLNE